MEVEPGLPSLVLDGTELEQVLVNLIANAIQAIDGSGSIMISARVEGPEVSISVHDDGRGFDVHGVPPDHLGLGIMRERAGAIGAELTIDSQVGQGTEIVAVWSNSTAGSRQG